MLTAILSPDYVDLTGDGITDDDLGTAIKFNYSKTAGNYYWRTPVEEGKAMLNKGLLADPYDDKASFIYGEKELWYLHSIETKTKIAYFITEDRRDGFGVHKMIGDQPSGEASAKQKCLREIRLFAKADLTKTIKTVKLSQAYELCPGTPNGEPGKYKMQLNSVHFEYGGSTKGKHHPYRFEYASNLAYARQSTDKWGGYKHASQNSHGGFGALKNEEFPYTPQDSATVNENIKAWKLSKIILPTGGSIDVDYESDDYAYVQDRRAMEMTRVLGLLKADGTSTDDLYEARGIRIAVDAGSRPASGEDHTRWFVRDYLNGENNMYWKFNVHLTDQVDATQDFHYDFVPGYGQVSAVSYHDNVVDVQFVEIPEGGITANPVTVAALQRMRLEYQKYAYPGYKNRIDDNRPIAAALNAIVNSFGNMAELFIPFNTRAKNKRFAAKVNLAKSFVRVAVGDGIKFGGGSRVKRVKINDAWNTMVEGATAASYGMEYEYRMRENGRDVSSGVATYEPSLGGDDNPMRLPDRYDQKGALALTNMFYLEEPMGETLFPAPSVGYREVRVYSLDETGGRDTDNKTGWSVHQFYTAKEYPVIVSNTNIEKYEHKRSTLFTIFGGTATYEKVLSQGYSIVLNDMHGQPKATQVMNQQGQVVSSEEYIYNTSDDGGRTRLKNEVAVSDENGRISNGVIGRDIEMYVDMRESEVLNDGKALNAGGDVFPVPFPVMVMGIGHAPGGDNNDYRLYRSAVVLKLIRYSAVVDKVIKTINGSRIEAKNLVYDKYTGNPVVTSTQNEFEDEVYTTTIPAYWRYKEMGLAYQSLNILTELKVSGNGQLENPTLGAMLGAGDELVDMNDGRRLWVVNSTSNSTGMPAKRVIDGSGRTLGSNRQQVKVIRSGYRNQLGAGLTSITTMKNPVENGRLAVLNDAVLNNFNVLDASALLYADDWGMAGDCNIKTCPSGYVEGPNGSCIIEANVRPANFLNVVKGSSVRQYSERGAFFYDEPETGTAHYATSVKPYWYDKTTFTGRLNTAGIWLTGVPLRQWCGFETTVNVVGGKYFLGYAADDACRIYINGALWRELPETTNKNNYRAWRIKELTLLQGNNHIKMIAYNGTTDNAMAFEIYGASSDHSLREGLASQIDQEMIFSTKDLITNSQYVQTFTCDANGNKLYTRYYCNDMRNFQYTAGIPNCGILAQGQCPPGYVDGPDGLSCIRPATQSTPVISLVTGSQLTIYGAWGARIINNDLVTARDTIRNDSYWGWSCSSGSSSALRTLIPAPAPVLALQGDTLPSSANLTTNATVELCGRLNNAGVWVNASSYNENENIWVGFNKCLQIPESKYYYIGVAADNEYRVFLNGAPQPVISHLMKNSGDSGPFSFWSFYPVYLPQGQHKITMEARNTLGQRTMALEVYDGDIQDLKDHTQQTLFSTASLRNNEMVDLYIRSHATNEIIYRKYSCPNGDLDICSEPFNCGSMPKGDALNPYLYGYKGNWRVWQQKAWLTSRSGQDLVNTSAPGVGVRANGHYMEFRPFWTNLGTLWSTSSNQNWVTTNTITQYDKYSAEIENKDALNRYSGARMNFKESLPGIVGTNARHRELFYDGFEDYKFNQTCLAVAPCEPDNFNIQKFLGTNYNTWLSADESHTGNYSLRLLSEITLQAYVFDHEHAPGIYLSTNSRGEYFRNTAPWLGLRGFNPMLNKRYIVSAWVKGGAANQPAMTLRIGNTNIPLKVKARVEGWKLVEGELDLPLLTGNTDMASWSLKINNAGAQVLLDDLRIFPVEGQVKTFAYDAATMRVMAELDENNYATFYEYDDEGSLIRLKKETERGIMTIKESRSSMKKL
ncbi:hypothetical protein MKQ68_10830 [Chitinophaga horti]|uniref:PA14 domain-containing protein n=1 Tax=Chitinophaga horti TaxID=2920382 RepID=A0ABY6J7E3_9BACT|nr:hypothetical protein [Chitinophaga horti]UYQ95595.1 hypothetical protein MKQ68_10830 [Chitinophaga horti]